MTIGQYIKELRTSRNLSLMQLSIKSGVSKTAITMIEQDKRHPKQETLEAIAAALGVTPEHIREVSEGQQEPSYSEADRIPVEMVNLPVVGTIRAGMPILAIENIEKYMPVATTFLRKSKEYYILRVKGDSMDREFKEGTYVVIEKTDVVEDGNIAVVGINGDEATIKKVQFADGGIILIPLSHNPEHLPKYYHMKKDEVHIYGRLKLSITEY